MSRSHRALLASLEHLLAAISARSQPRVHRLVFVLLCAGLLACILPGVALAAESPEEAALSSAHFRETLSGGFQHSCAIRSNGTLGAC